MSKTWKWYVYILKCKDGSYYTGLTWNLGLRFQQHVSGEGSRYTSEKGVERLAYAEEHDDFSVARYREQQIKDWSRRKKEKLINREWSRDWD